jgi:hypothetical protein
MTSTAVPIPDDANVMQVTEERPARRRPITPGSSRERGVRTQRSSIRGARREGVRC